MTRRENNTANSNKVLYLIDDPSQSKNAKGGNLDCQTNLEKAN